MLTVARIPGVDRLFYWEDLPPEEPPPGVPLEDWTARFWAAVDAIGAGDVDGYVQLARLIKADPGGWAQAALFERAIEDGVTGALYDLGVVRARQRHRKAARRAWRTAFANGDRRAAVDLASDYGAVDANKKAIKWALLADDPEWTPFEISMAQEYMGDLDGRRETLTQAKETSGSAASEWARERYGEFDPVEAIKVLQTHHNRGNLEVGIVLSNLYQEVGKIKQAIKVLTRDHLAGSLLATHNLGLLLTKLGKRRKGLNLIAEAAARGDTKAQHHLKRRLRELPS